MNKNKIDNREQIEKAINKLPYSLGSKASEMLKAYVDDDREKYIALANQFDKEVAETSQEINRLQYGLQLARNYAELIVPYIQPWLAQKPEKTDENPNLAAPKVTGNQKVGSASAKSKAK